MYWWSYGKSKKFKKETNCSIQLITDPDPGGPKVTNPQGPVPERGLAESRPRPTTLVTTFVGLAAVLRIRMRDPVLF
jgi:hypothetical protein